MGGFLEVAFALVVLVFVFLLMGVRVVRQGYVYTIERLGRYTLAAQPGLTLIIPFVALAGTLLYNYSPLGQLGYYLVSDGKKTPYRLKMRTPSFFNISMIAYLLEGALLSDMIAILGSVFFVVGDVDR